MENRLYFLRADFEWKNVFTQQLGPRYKSKAASKVKGYGSKGKFVYSVPSPFPICFVDNIN